VTYELRIERVIDGPRESVFDAFVDPGAQRLLYGDPETPGWSVTSQLALQLGGKWTIDFGKPQLFNRETNVFTEIDRPRRLVFDSTMYIAEQGHSFDTKLVVTFEERGASTLATIIQSGFERREDRDTIKGGWPSILDALEDLVAGRIAT
jgi:uncharacterized protein YndB with AHSA1/START domain